MKILGIDPGITTGFALVDVTGPDCMTKIQGGVVRGYEGLYTLLKLGASADAVVMENFTLWPKMAVKVSSDDPELLTPRYIGAITMWFKFVAPKPLTFQQPALKKACPGFLLSSLKLTGQTEHEMDALRHVVVYARREYVTQKRKLVKDVVNWETE